MKVWIAALLASVNGSELPSHYVYLPIYAQLLAALYMPFHFIGIHSVWLLFFITHMPILISYIYSVNVMTSLADSLDFDIAPIAIVLSPVTIFYIFFGTNHIVMFFCIACGLCLLKRRYFFYAGVMAGLSCFKFIMIPTIGVLWCAIAFRKKWKPTLLFTIGGLLTLVPSMIYYYEHITVLSQISNKLGATGGNCHHLEIFHFFHFLNYSPTFTSIYINNKLWFLLCVSGSIIATILYLKNRFTLLRALGFSAGVVALFCLEPFRLEPTIGLLWLDAIANKDLKMQTSICILIFVHMASWFPQASPSLLSLSSATPIWLWEYRGLFLGFALVYLLTTALFSKGMVDQFKRHNAVLSDTMD